MAKKTKTLADVQTVTTVNDDQLIPITDASGNVVKVSMVNLRAALIGNLQFSSINLIDGSKSVTVAAGANVNAYAKIPIDGLVNGGDEFAVSIGNISVLEGDADKFRVAIYDSALSINFSEYNSMTLDNKTCVLKINNLAKNSSATLLLYAGVFSGTAGNTVRYDNVMLTRGNMPCPTWAPSINDQKQNAIDGVKVGGVNLLNDSEKLTAANWTKISANLSYEEYEGYTCVVIRNSESGGVRCNQTFETGKDVISSVWVFAEQICKIGLGIEGYSNYSYTLSEDEVGKWVRISLKQKTTGNKFVCYLLGGQTSYVVAFRMANMQEGNIETDWFPSYNDLKAQFAPAVLSSESE